MWLARVMGGIMRGNGEGEGEVIPRRPPIWEHPGAGEKEAAMPADNHRTLASSSSLWCEDSALYSMVIHGFVGAVCGVEVCESIGRRGGLGVCHD